MRTGIYPGCLFFFYALFLSGLAAKSPVTSHVLIVSGLAGDQVEEDRLTGLRQRMAAAFTERKIAPADVETMAAANREQILAKLKQLGSTLPSGDLFWLILLGHSQNRGSSVVFQVKGPRLTAEDLKGSLAGISAHQYIIITTEDSGGFLPILAAPNRVCITAAASSGELNETVFPEAFAEALEDPKNCSLLQLARATAQKIRQRYDGRTLVQTEHALLQDPLQPQPWPEPFDKITGPSMADQESLLPTGARPDIPLTAASSSLDEPPAPPKPSQMITEIGHHVATPETLAIVRQAKSLPDSGNSPAIILKKEVNCLINNDQTQIVVTHQRVLIKRAAGTSWGELNFSSQGELGELEVESARTIFPDGTYLEPGTDARVQITSGDYVPITHLSVRLPAVTSGTILDYTLRERRAPDATLAGVYLELPMTEEIPVVEGELNLRLPKNGSILYKLRNLPGEPVVTTENYVTSLHWSWKNLPAQEQLEFDPPLKQTQGLVLISSFKTWKDFAIWYQRITQGSDVGGERTKKAALEITQGNASDLDKLHALFLEVSRIHYAAIEIGVGALRAHDPDSVLDKNYGDCKDKANLLIALAKQVGIEGRLALLNRTSFTDRAFPGFQFNHALAYFPGVGEGLWLDTTDEVCAFGHLPPGDVGREAFLLPKVGAEPEFKTIAIPASQATRLTQHLGLTAQGSSCTLELKAQGVADYELRSGLRPLSGRAADFVIRSLLNKLVPGSTLRSYQVSDLDSLDAPVQINCNFDALPGGGFQLARMTGLPMNLLQATAQASREIPLVLNDGQPFEVRQSVDLIDFGKGSLPSSTQCTGPGLIGSITYQRQGTTVTRELSIQVTQATIAPSDYSAFRLAIQKIFQAVLNTPQN